LQEDRSYKEDLLETPYNVPNISGVKGFITFIDDCTRMTWVYLLKRKADVSHIFPNFTKMIKNQFGVSIKGIRTDNARDYFNKILSPYFEKEGIIHQSSCVNTPQQNGLPKRKTYIFSKLLELYFFNIKFQNTIGEKLF
jgi:hypothetical protein